MCDKNMIGKNVKNIFNDTINIKHLEMYKILVLHYP